MVFSAGAKGMFFSFKKAVHCVIPEAINFNWSASHKACFQMGVEGCIAADACVFIGVVVGITEVSPFCTVFKN